MWRILLASVSKAFTAPSPAGPSERFRGLPTVDPSRCTREAACLSACPTGAITLDDDLAHGRTHWTIDLARCLFCGLCQEACPSGAITLAPQDELAVRAFEDLRLSTPLAMPQAGQED